MRFFFLKIAYAKPSGGHKQIRLLASALNASEVTAALLFVEGNPADDWTFGVEVPLAPFTIEEAPTALCSEDVVVFPESNIDRYLKIIESWPCRKVVLCQNGYYALASRPRGGYPRHKINLVVATSSYIAALARTALGMPARSILHLPCWVYRAPFLPPPPASPRNLDTICYMPRKLPEHARKIRAEVARSQPKVRWVEIVDASEEAVAATFHSCGIFLSTQDREGFGLPALEAMSCGCLVAGYPGTGHFPHPYASPENGFWAPDRSVAAAARQVGQALEVVREQGDELQRRRSVGQSAAARYSWEPFKRGVDRLIAASRGLPFDYDRTALRPLGAGAWWEMAQILRRKLLAPTPANTLRSEKERSTQG